MDNGNTAEAGVVRGNNDDGGEGEGEVCGGEAKGPMGKLWAIGGKMMEKEMYRVFSIRAQAQVFQKIMGQSSIQKFEK